MHGLILLLSIVSLDVSRSREFDVPTSIERTLMRLSAGVVASLGGVDTFSFAARRTLEGNSSFVAVYNVRLYVDGQRDVNPSARVIRSIWRLWQFALDKGRVGQSVELRYMLVCRDATIARRTFVRDGEIISVAVWHGVVGPQGRLKAVVASVHARESPIGTRITIAATISANTGICHARSTSRFAVVNRMASRSIAGRLDNALATVESQERDLAKRGHDAIARLAGDVVHEVIHTVRGD